MNQVLRDDAGTLIFISWTLSKKKKTLGPPSPSLAVNFLGGVDSTKKEVLLATLLFRRAISNYSKSLHGTVVTNSHPCSSLFLNPATLPIQSAINPQFRRLFSFEIASNKNRKFSGFTLGNCGFFSERLGLNHFGLSQTRRAQKRPFWIGMSTFHSPTCLPSGNGGKS